MSTSHREDAKIVDLCLEIMTPADAAQLFAQLDDHVGRTSDNESVRESLTNLRQLTAHVASMHPVMSSVPDGVCLGLLVSLVAWHLVMVLTNIAAFFVAPIYAPWYVAAPACFSIVWVTCSPVACVLTRWENDLRRRLGLPMVKSFIGHYCLRPIYTGMTRMGLLSAPSIR